MHLLRTIGMQRNILSMQVAKSDQDLLIKYLALLKASAQLDNKLVRESTVQAEVHTGKEEQLLTQINDLKLELLITTKQLNRIEKNITNFQIRLSESSNQASKESLHEKATMQRKIAEQKEDFRKVAQREIELREHISKIEAQVQAIQEKHTTAVAAAAANDKSIKVQQLAIQNEQANIRQAIDPKLFNLYLEIKSNNGHGAGLLVGGCCTACGFLLNSKDLYTIQAASSEELVYCDECGSILLRS